MLFNMFFIFMLFIYVFFLLFMFELDLFFVSVVCFEFFSAILTAYTNKIWKIEIPTLFDIQYVL